MIVFPNGKINLGLHVLNKRPDGYHNIESIMYPIKLHDAMEFIPSKKDNFQLTGTALDSQNLKDNLVYKALQLVREKFNIPPLNIHLHKGIPAGAGLGGGSADASFMLKLLNEYFNLELPTDELKELALKIGSDCPFFIDNKAVYAEGQGEKLSEINLTLDKYNIVIIVPPIHISTAEAYRRITPNSNRPKIIDIIYKPMAQWRNLLINDFETSMAEIYPRIEFIKETLYNAGAIYASLSGSGSAIYSIFEHAPSSINLHDCKIYYA